MVKEPVEHYLTKDGQGKLCNAQDVNLKKGMKYDAPSALIINHTNLG